MLLNYESLSKMENFQKKFGVENISFAFLNEYTNQNYLGNYNANEGNVRNEKYIK